MTSRPIIRPVSAGVGQIEVHVRAAVDVVRARTSSGFAAFARFELRTRQARRIHPSKQLTGSGVLNPFLLLLLRLRGRHATTSNQGAKHTCQGIEPTCANDCAEH